MRLAKEFIQTINSVYEPAGQEWLDNLDANLRQIQCSHRIAIGGPLPNLSYSLVCNAWDEHGKEAILRWAPRNKESDLELAALQALQSGAMVRLLKVLPEGATLLEKLNPGTTLEHIESKEQDENATRVLSNTIRQLHSRSEVENSNFQIESFPTTRNWADEFQRLRKMFNGGTGPLDPDDVEKAERTFDELHSSPETPFRLLHGDLHHGNVLLSKRGWVAIDPKGVVGELAYETGAMLRNPRQYIHRSRNLKPILERRIQILSEELQCDSHRIRAYAFAQAVLSAWWTIEDHEELDSRALQVADALR